MIYLGNYNLTLPKQLNFVATNIHNNNTTTIVFYASTVLELDNNIIRKIESVPPFSLCGDKMDGSTTSTFLFLPFTKLKFGFHTLKVTPYTGIDGTGIAGSMTSFSFTVVSGKGQQQQQPPQLSPIVTPTPVVMPVPTTANPVTITPTTRPVTTSTARPTTAHPVSTLQPTAQRPVTLPPTNSPNSSCTLPKFVGEWETTMQPYPLPLSEAQGILFGNDFVLISGFTKRYQLVTPKVYALDVTTTSTNTTTMVSWREMTPLPLPSGLTHGAFVKVNNTNTMYICGGYVGSHPGPATNACFIYEHDKPIGSQWSSFPPLPAQRAGGGMWYDKIRNSLTFTAGSSRPDPLHPIYTIDHNDTWEIYLHQPNEWIVRANVPYAGNHVGFTTVLYHGIERHYIAGGQLGEDEYESNLHDLIEWIPNENVFVRRTNLREPRGHFASSTVPYKNCGFLIAGGAINDNERTDEVTYYDIEKDEWFIIGTIPGILTSPVCVITNDHYFRCETGYVNKPFSWRVGIV